MIFDVFLASTLVKLLWSDVESWNVTCLSDNFYVIISASRNVHNVSKTNLTDCKLQTFKLWHTFFQLTQKEKVQQFLYNGNHSHWNLKTFWTLYLPIGAAEWEWYFQNYNSGAEVSAFHYRLFWYWPPGQSCVPAVCNTYGCLLFERHLWFAAKIVKHSLNCGQS